MLKTVVLLHIFRIVCFRILWLTEKSKEKHLFEIEIFCHIINVFTVTLDQFDASLINKCVHFFFFILINFWILAYHISTVIFSMQHNCFQHW